MTPEVEDRIEQIRHGNVPDGYIKVETAIIPDKWREVTLGDVINVFRGASPRPKGDPRYYGGSIPRLLIEDLTRDGKCAIPQIDFLTEEGAQKSRLLPKGSLVMSCSGTRVGIIGFLGVDACIHDGFFGFNGYKGIAPEYLYQYFQLISQSLQSSATQGGVFNNLTTDIMKTMKCCFPPVDEQHEIVKILTTQDKVIELKERRLAEKQRQKKYLMQQLLTGKKRLPGFDGEWKAVKLSEVLLERKEKNAKQDHRICSVAVQKGVVDQIEHLGRSYAAADTSNYGVARYGDIIYTKSPTGDFPYGIIKQSQMNEAVAVSPLYGIYEPVCYELGYILHTYFGYAVNCSNYLLPIIQKGAKNTINITNDVFASNKLLLPMDHNEQKALAEIFIAADKEIDLLRQDIEHEKKKKKALMQLLLTGIVRV